MRTLSPAGRLIAFLYIILNVFVIAAEKLRPEFGATLLEEDRFVENMTALALTVSALIILYRSLQNATGGLYLKGLLQFFLALLLIFMAGEEISWGQRIFHWETTGLFKKDNLQQETNFHNLQVDGMKLNKIIFTYAFFAIGIFVFFLSPFLYSKKTGFRRFVNRLGATVPGYAQTALLIIGLLFVLLLSNSRKWELWECNAAIVILWVMAEPLNGSEIFKRKEGSAIHNDSNHS